MPGAANIESPITLIANGRSGTSLVMHVLGDRADVDACGETQQLLCGTWFAAERAKGLIRPDQTLDDGAAFGDRCAAVVRAAFLAMFPDTGAPLWMHKPIGVPWVFGLPQMRQMPPGERLAWYWNVLKTSFPASRNITVLRHPYDVVLSAEQYWGANHAGAWRSIVTMAQIIDHPASDIRFAASHARLVTEPEAEVARLLDHLGLDPDPASLDATGKVFVPQMGRNRVPKEKLPDQVGRGFSRRDDWHRIDMSAFTDAQREVLVRMWARFGEVLEF